MTEQIGKVTLDLSHYPGEDYYCDGTVEDEILEIVKNAPAGDYQKQIEEKKYAEGLKRTGMKKIIKYGIAFYGKACMVATVHSCMESTE